MPPFEPAPRGASPRWLLGLDEAGRGSVLGPLVVGGFCVREDCVDQLVELGVRDSKLLSPSRREKLFHALGPLGRRYWTALPPARIDAHVRGHRLNALEAQAFGGLVRRARPELTLVDACDVDARRFGREVARHAGVDVDRVDARHKADRDLPVVAAASIVAKVQRDRAMDRLSRGSPWALGSGYPADPVTRRAVEQMLAGPSPPPPWLRRSWATTETLMPKPAPRALESFGP